MNDVKIALLGVLLLLAMLLGASWGAIDVPVLSIPRILIERSPELEFQILWNIRLPRVLTGHWWACAWPWRERSCNASCAIR